MEQEFFAGMGKLTREALGQFDKGLEAFVQMQQDGLQKGRELLDQGFDQADKMIAPVEEAVVAGLSDLPAGQKYAKAPFETVRKLHGIQRKSAETAFDLYGRLLDSSAKQLLATTRSAVEFVERVGQAHS